MRAEYPSEALCEYYAPLAEKPFSASGCVFTGNKIMSASASFGFFREIRRNGAKRKARYAKFFTRGSIYNLIVYGILTVVT